MILIDGVKYSCLECVRGHRSSLCRHHTRPLLQVRSKGRPNVVLSTRNKNHRIAVFAEEIASSPEPEGPDCKKLPVVILKASDKHIIDLSSGQIVGPYNEEEQKNRIFNPVIRPESFVNSTGCCSQGVSKIRKLCSCNHKQVSKSKILSTYITKMMNALNGETGSCCSKRDDSTSSYKMEENALCCSKKVQVPKLEEKQQVMALCCSKKKPPDTDANLGLKMKTEPFSEASDTTKIRTEETEATERKTPNFKFSQFVELQDTTRNFPFNSRPTYMAQSPREEVFEVINVPSCSIPGSCCCSSDCQCPNCEVHNNVAQVSNLQCLNNDTQFGSNLILTSKDGSFHDQNALSHTIANPLDQNIHSVQIERDGSSNFPLNQTNDAYQQHSLQSLHQSLQQQTQQTHQNHQQFFNDGSFRDIDSLGFIQLLLNPNTPENEVPAADQADSCTCPDDACFCQNCEAHGIIEGYKLDDIFVSKAPFDLLS